VPESDEHIDERNKDMFDFVKQKCAGHFYGEITLRIQKGVIESIRQFESFTRSSVSKNAASPC
jgi:hypothetical protein